MAQNIIGPVRNALALLREYTHADGRAERALVLASRRPGTHPVTLTLPAGEWRDALGGETLAGGEVTLDGTVDSRFARRHAEDLAEGCSGVRHVQNNLRVQDQSYGSTSMGNQSGASQSGGYSAAGTGGVGTSTGASGSSNSASTSSGAGQSYTTSDTKRS